MIKGGFKRGKLRLAAIPPRGLVRFLLRKVFRTIRLELRVGRSLRRLLLLLFGLLRGALGVHVFFEEAPSRET